MKTKYLIVIFAALLIATAAAAQVPRTKMYKKALKLEKKRPDQCRSTLEHLANEGYAPAQFKLFKMGETSMLEEAALGGHYDAIYYMSGIYRNLMEETLNRGRNEYLQLDKKNEDIATIIRKLERDGGIFDYYREKVLKMKKSAENLTDKDYDYYPEDAKKKMKVYHANLLEMCERNLDIINVYSQEFQRLLDDFRQYKKPDVTK